jgi:hypothetical protein
VAFIGLLPNNRGVLRSVHIYFSRITQSRDFLLTVGAAIDVASGGIGPMEAGHLIGELLKQRSGGTILRGNLRYEYRKEKEVESLTIITARAAEPPSRTHGKPVRGLYATGVLSGGNLAHVPQIRELRPDLAQFAIRYGARCDFTRVILVMPHQYAEYIDRRSTGRWHPMLSVIGIDADFFYIPVQNRDLGSIVETRAGSYGIPHSESIPILRVVGPPIVVNPKERDPCGWTKR